MDVVWNQALALQRIRVLFVDHDETHDASIKEMFAYFSCEVTIVRLASKALTMFSTENCPFDLLMESVEYPDLYGRQLLHNATLIGLPTMLMADSVDPLTVLRGMEEGAIFCVQRPLSLESVKYAWQHVVREKVYKIREAKKVQEVKSHYESLNMGTRRENHNNVQHVIVEQSDKIFKSVRTQQNSNNGEGSSVQNQNFHRGGQDHWMEWTPELHAKFVNAIMTLGEERCYPNDILEVMNVPGLTKMQVESYLQKWRMGMCHYSVGGDHDTYYNVALQDEMSLERSRRFGTIPCIANHSGRNANEGHMENYSVEDPTINPNIQDNIENNLVEDPNAHLMQNDNHGLNSQVHINQQESIGHVPFENMEFGGMGNGNLSINDTIMSDDLSIFDYPIGMNENINLGELLKECGLDGGVN